MEAVEKLYDVESAFINIEMNIPFLKIGSTCFPHFRLRVKRFDALPCSRANTFAVGIRADKQKIQMIVLCLFIDLQHKSPDNPSILANPVGNTLVDAVVKPHTT